MDRVPEPPEVPPDWDQLHEQEAEPGREPSEVHPGRTGRPPVIGLVGAAWGDLVCVLAVAAAALLALAVLGEPAGRAALPWAVALGVAWWAAAAAALVVVRQATPGMLLAGIAFDRPVPRHRVPWVVGAGLLVWASFGIAALAGARGSPLRLAAAVEVVTSGRGAGRPVTLAGV
jgi:hypothetical protein